MILNCPSCSAKFMISSEALGADGREVRCGKCSHMWFQPGERDSLDDLPIDPPEYSASSENNSFDIGFEPHQDVVEFIPEALKPRVTPQDDQIETESKLERLFPLQKQKHVAAFMIALAIIMTLFYTFVSHRDYLGRKMPFLGAAYEKMGFHLLPVKPQIAFDRLKISKEGTKITGTGYVQNLTSEDLPISYITVDLTDFDYKTIKSIEIRMASKTLEAEAAEKIEFFFEDVPKDAVSVSVRLVQ